MAKPVRPQRPSIKNDADAPHIPVMLAEVLDALAPVDGGVYVDGTFGAGGYTKAILAAAACDVWALDRDETAYDTALALAADYGGRLKPVHTDFGNALHALGDEMVGKVDGIVLDLGVSSMQIDQPERGFSFQRDGALDMRMDRSSGMSAADLIASIDEEELADILYLYGEEKKSRRIARAIVAERARTPIVTTLQLAAVIESVMPRQYGGHKIHPATRSFQALRIAVNDELGQLRQILTASLSLLCEGGRLVVVSFHSLEDGLVKRFLKRYAGQMSGSSRFLPDQVDASSDSSVYFSKISKKPVDPTEAETLVNPRARSARLRYGVRSARPYYGGEVVFDE